MGAEEVSGFVILLYACDGPYGSEQQQLVIAVAGWHFETISKAVMTVKGVRNGDDQLFLNPVPVFLCQRGKDF